MQMNAGVDEACAATLIVDWDRASVDSMRTLRTRKSARRAWTATITAQTDSCNGFNHYGLFSNDRSRLQHSHKSKADLNFPKRRHAVRPDQHCRICWNRAFHQRRVRLGHFAAAELDSARPATRALALSGQHIEGVSAEDVGRPSLHCEAGCRKFVQKGRSLQF